jgi:hypothetical protein
MKQTGFFVKFASVGAALIVWIVSHAACAQQAPGLETQPVPQVLVSHVTAQMCGMLQSFGMVCKQTVAIIITPNSGTETGYLVSIKYIGSDSKTHADSKYVQRAAQSDTSAVWYLDNVAGISANVQAQGAIGPAVEVTAQ